MSLPLIIHSIILTLTIIFSFVWTNNPELSKFSLQLTGLLLAIFLFHDLLSRKLHPENPIQRHKNISNSIIISLLALLLVHATGSLTSPLFFILDFLIFGLSVFFYPGLGFFFSLALTTGFLLNNDLSATHSLTNLISLLLMAPIARYFGSLYLRLLEEKNHIKILNHQSKHLEKQIQAEETSTLIWLSTQFSNKLDHAIDLISQISSNLSNIPYHQQEQLKNLYSDLKKLFKSGQELKKQIDELTDED